MSVLLGCGCVFHEAGLTRCPTANGLVNDYNYYRTNGKWKAAANDVHERYVSHYREQWAAYEQNKS